MDGGKIHLNKFGVPTLTTGIPTRYIHGHVGIIQRDDYDNAVKLLVEVLKKLDQKELEKITPR
jgi:putative aminopeptidase FrvX